MYSALITFLKEQNYFIVTEYGKLHNSCCTSSKIPVLDFIAIKTKIYSVLNTHMPSSLSAIFVSKANNVYFMTEAFHTTYAQDESQSIVSKFKDTVLDEKIEGTISTLSAITSKHTIGNDFTSLLPSEPREKIKLIIICDIPDQHYLKLRIGQLEILRSKQHPIVGDKILMTCEKFEEQAA